MGFSSFKSRLAMGCGSSQKSGKGTDFVQLYKTYHDIRIHPSQRKKGFLEPRTRVDSDKTIEGDHSGLKGSGCAPLHDSDSEGTTMTIDTDLRVEQRGDMTVLMTPPRESESSELLYITR